MPRSFWPMYSLITTLVALTSHGNEQAKKNAANTLWTLAGANQKYKDAIKRVGYNGALPEPFDYALAAFNTELEALIGQMRGVTIERARELRERAEQLQQRALSQNQPEIASALAASFAASLESDQSEDGEDEGGRG